MVIGGNPGYYFFWRSAKLKTCGTFTISHLIHIAIMHETMRFRLAKGQAERQGPWTS